MEMQRVMAIIKGKRLNLKNDIVLLAAESSSALI
jgi:hypothetical protein